MIGTIVSGLIIVAIAAISPKVWKWAKQPITHLAKSEADWSADDRRMLTEAGYDLSNLQWVEKHDIPRALSRGCKPVRIPRWRIVKREVHQIRKGYTLLLMDKP